MNEVLNYISVECMSEIVMKQLVQIERILDPDERAWSYHKCAHDRANHLRVVREFVDLAGDEVREFTIGRMFLDGDGSLCVFLGIGCSRKYETVPLSIGDQAVAHIPQIQFLPPSVLYTYNYKGEVHFAENTPEIFFRGREGEKPTFGSWL
jgi:hypothetical protein